MAVVPVYHRWSLFWVVIRLGDLGEQDHVPRPLAGGADVRRSAAIGGRQWLSADGGRRTAGPNIDSHIASLFSLTHWLHN